MRSFIIIKIFFYIVLKINFFQFEILKKVIFIKNLFMQKKLYFKKNIYLLFIT